MPIWRHHLFFTCKNPLPQKWKPLSVAGGNVKWDCLCGTLYDDSSKKKKIKIQNTFDPAIPTKVGIWIGICLSVFRAALFIIAKRWKEPRCPLMDEWTNIMWYICATEYYTVLKRNEILIHATTRVNLEDIMCSERSQSQKDNYCVILFHSERRSGTVVSRGWKRGDWDLLLSMKFQFVLMRKFWR